MSMIFAKVPVLARRTQAVPAPLRMPPGCGPEAVLNETVAAGRLPVFGADRITRLILHGRLVPRQLRQSPERVSRHVIPINGEAGIVTVVDGRMLSTLSIRTNGVQILAINQVLNPDKLAHVTSLPQS